MTIDPDKINKATSITENQTQMLADLINGTAPGSPHQSIEEDLYRWTELGLSIRARGAMKELGEAWHEITSGL